VNSLTRIRHSVSLLGTILLLALTAAPHAAFAQRGLKVIPDPDPKKQQASFKLPEGFEINLYASDPMIAKPIQINFDSMGRLWVASSEIYPHIKPGQKANDKIIVLQDTTGDGKADQRTVFADGLLIPTSVIPGDSIDDGQMSAYVANSTELLHLIDMDFNDVADKKRVVLSGFGTEDTHHILHTLRWGVDGRLYFNQSIYIHSHIETPYGVKRLNGGGIWRFRPDSMKLEVHAYGFINPWGHHFDRWGQEFATDGAYGEGINYIIRGAGYQWTQSFKPWLKGLNPGQPKHCGLEVLSGRHLPEAWRGVLVANDFRGHRINCFKLTEDGSGFKSRQIENLVTSSHKAFRPIDVKMGPDGAIYIADFYNPIIQHGEVDFRDKRRDHVHGRIWRITYKGRPLVEMPELVDADLADVVEALKAPEDFTRLHAKRKLKLRERDEVLPQLGDWVKALDPKEEGYEHHRLEALWSYQTIDHVEPKLLAAVLKSPDHRARAAATRVVGFWAKKLDNPLELLDAAVRDDHPRVRLEAVRALALLESREAAEAALSALDRPIDRFLEYALMLTARDLQNHWLPELQAGKMVFNGDARRLSFALKAAGSPNVVGPLVKLVNQNKIPAAQQQGVLELIGQLGGPNELKIVFEKALATDQEKINRSALLDALADALQQRKARPAGDINRLVSLLDDEQIPVRVAAARLTGLWKIGSAGDKLNSIATDEKADAELRQAAIFALARVGGQNKKHLLALATEGKPLSGVTAIEALAEIDLSNAAAFAKNHFAKPLPTGPNPEAGIEKIFRALMSKQQGPKILVGILKNTEIHADVARIGLRELNRSSRRAPQLAQALMKAGNLANPVRKLTAEQMQQMIADVTKLGNAARGEAIFRREKLGCMNCHAIGGAGGRLGPDLSSIGSSAQIDYLIEAMLEPNKAIKEGFHAVVVSTKDGNVIAGIPVRKTKQQLVLRVVDDKEMTIPTSNIESQASSQSLMPAGLVDPLTRAERLDLVAFLSQLGKQGPYAISRARVARRWKVLFWTSELGRKLRASSIALAATDDPVLKWAPRYSNVQGALPMADIPGVRRFRKDPYGFVRCEVDVTTPGKLRFGLNSTDGLSLWVDGKTVAPAKDIEVDLTRGRHSITFVIDMPKRKDGLRLEMLDVPGSDASAQFVSGK